MMTIKAQQALNLQIWKYQANFFQIKTIMLSSFYKYPGNEYV